MSGEKREYARGVVNLGALQAFDEYTDTVSWVRVTRACCFSIAPAFVVMTLIELMPLAPIEAGWAANWVLWIRVYFTGMASSIGICTIYRIFAPAARLSTTSILSIAVVSSCGFVLCGIALAKLWIFPVPFSILVCTPIWMMCFVVCSVFAIGWNNIRTNKQLREQLAPLPMLINAQSIMIFVYPAYNAGFIALSGIAQVAFILVLPTIKYSMKWFLKRVGNHTTGSYVLVMASVDFFEAMYLFKCMQSVGSIESGLAVILVDLVQNIIHVRGLYRKVCFLEEGLNEHTSQLNGRNLVRSLVQISQGPVIFRSRYPQLSRNTISPLPTGTKVPFSIAQPALSNEVSAVIDDFFLECQEVLFVEYIECIAPVFYALYTTVLFHLPNVTYYPELRNMTIGTLNSLLGNIVIYAGLECLSLVYMHLLLKWRFNLSAMHLLAFVLESERTAFQATFVNWAVINMQYTLVHYGKQA